MPARSAGTQVALIDGRYNREGKFKAFGNSEHRIYSLVLRLVLELPSVENNADLAEITLKTV